MNTQEKCKNCSGWADGDYGSCGDCGRPLAYSKSSKTTTKDDKLRMGAEIFARDFEGVMKELAEETTTKDWEEDLDNWQIDKPWINYHIGEPCLKAFIKSKLQEERKKVLNILDEMRKRDVPGEMGGGYDFAIVDFEERFNLSE